MKGEVELYIQTKLSFTLLNESNLPVIMVGFYSSDNFKWWLNALFMLSSLEMSYFK